MQKVVAHRAGQRPKDKNREKLREYDSEGKFRTFQDHSSPD